MDEQQAINTIKTYITEHGFNYPVDNLVAERFEIGWTVFSPVEVTDKPEDIPIGRSLFLIGDNGQIEESSSSRPPGQAEAEFTRKYQSPSN